MNSDRNLLFGILALQMNFISRDQLVDSISLWVTNKSKLLEDILDEQGVLPTEAKSVLTPLVEIHIQQHGNDVTQSLAVLSSVDSIRHALRTLGDGDVDASIAHLPASSPDSTMPFGQQLESQRYRILRPHARGGLGQVSIALDAELNREVALKEIQDQFADDNQSRSRFVIEAEITGGLEHPGIVPIYGLGRYCDGRPYYAMRFIRGESLKHAVDDYHNDKSAPPGEKSLQLRKLLGRFVDVCNAIEYAHSRGVLHRDLKPGNIMLGKHGETLVVDWGLAKPVGRSTETSSDEKTLNPGSGSSSAPTQMGKAIGTPAYMSPEQAEGRLDELGAATDVYSLGATLYYMLAGQAPVKGETGEELLEQVRRGIVCPPYEVDGDIPKPLSAICMRAIATDQKQRYQSPQSLSDDVERFLADEPTTAYREPVRTRAKRWSRRHRSLVSSVAAAVIVGFLSVSIGSYWLMSQRRERMVALGGSLKTVQLLHARASANSSDIAAWREAAAAATQAIEAHGDLAETPAGRRLVAEFERISVGTEQAERDEALLNSLVEIRSGLLDDITDMTVKSSGEIADTAYSAAFLKAGYDLDGLGEDTVGKKLEARSKSVVETVAVSLDHWALMRKGRLADHDGARRLWNVARIIDGDSWRNRLRTILDQPTRLQRKQGLLGVWESSPTKSLSPTSLNMLAWAFRLHGLRDRAVSVLEEGVMLHPGDVWIAFQLGKLLESLGQKEGAVRYYSVARALRPETSHRLGHLLSNLGRSDEAVAIFQHLVTLRPHQDSHAGCLGRILQGLGRTKDANEAFQQAVTAARTHFASEPTRVARQLTGYGETLLELENLAEAESVCRECLRNWSQGQPGSAFEFGAQSLLGSVLTKRKKYEEAELLLIAACEGLEQVDGTGSSSKSLEHIIELYQAWKKPMQAQEWTDRKLAIELGTKEAKSLKAQAKALAESDAVEQALQLYEEAARLPGQRLDLKAVRDLYARTLQWDKAADAALAATDIADGATLHLMYEAGRYEEFRKGRKAHLSGIDSSFDARVALLLPLEPELYNVARQLAELIGSPELDSWRWGFVGPIMYRIGELREWYDALPDDSPLRPGNDLLLAVTAYQDNSSDENRRKLQDQIIRDLTYAHGQISGTTLGKYWKNYIVKMSMVREAKRVLGDKDADLAGSNIRKWLELKQRADELSSGSDWQQAIALYEEAAALPGESLDYAGAADLYARMLDWKKAADCYVKSAGPANDRLICLLYAAGRDEEYRAARKLALSRLNDFSDESLWALATAVILLPLEEDVHELALKLADRMAKIKAEHAWQQARVGRLMYRLGQFDTWYEQQPEQERQYADTKLNETILRFRNDPSVDNRQDLEQQALGYVTGLQRALTPEGLAEPYFPNYILPLSYYRDVKETLGDPDYRTAGNDFLEGVRGREKTLELVKQFREADAETSAAQLEELLKLPVGSFGPLLTLSDQLTGEGRFQDSVRIILRALELDPSDQGAVCRALELAAYLGKNDEYNAIRNRLFAAAAESPVTDEVLQRCLLVPLEKRHHEFVRSLEKKRNAKPDNDPLAAWIAFRTGTFSRWWDSLATTSTLKRSPYINLLRALDQQVHEPTSFNHLNIQWWTARTHKDSQELVMRDNFVPQWNNGYLTGMTLLSEAFSALGQTIVNADLDKREIQRAFKESHELVKQAESKTKEADLMGAIQLYEQAAQLAGQAFHRDVGTLYARTLQWNKALDAYVVSVGPSHELTLHLLYETGRFDEYCAARKRYLDDFVERGNLSVYDSAISVALLPVEKELQGPARKLVANIEKLNAPEGWRRSRLGRLKFRLGEFDEWLAAEAEDCQRLLQNRICSAILAFQEDGTDENRQTLEQLSDVIETRLRSLVNDGKIIYPYWYEYIREISYYRDAQEALGAANAKDAGKNFHTSDNGRKPDKRGKM